MATIERLGSAYGGWHVRTDLLPDRARVISGGIGNDTSFDEELMRRFEARVIMVDPNPLALSTTSAHAYPCVFTLHQWAISGADGEVQFSLARSNGARIIAEGATRTVRTVTLDYLLCQYPDTALLKLDIEGAEFAALDAWRGRVLPEQIAIGIHHRYAPDARAAMRLIERVESFGYAVEHFQNEEVETCALFIRCPRP